MKRLFVLLAFPLLLGTVLIGCGPVEEGESGGQLQQQEQGGGGGL